LSKALRSLTKAQLIKEVERLRKTPQKKPKIIRAKKRKANGQILAGMDILKDDLLVVDEAKRLAYVHPEVKIVPGKIRIHGYAVRSFKKGQVVKMHHWFDYEPK
jgi:hypothetical protein